MKYASVAAIIPAALAASRTSAPEGCLSVSQSGSGEYSSIQAAVDSLPTDSSSPQCIFIDSGTYNEQVLVSSRSATQFSMYGYTQDDTSFSANTVTIVFGLSQNDGLSNDETATLRVHTGGFRLYNVNVENSYGEGSQAVAVSAQTDGGYYGCSMVGYQDTLLSNEGVQIYVDTQIVGATDFIFGHDAVAWFQDCDIRCVETSLGYVTAQGRESGSDDAWYVFDGCTVQAAEGDNVPDGAYYLGRPWREYARVVFQNTAMSAVINSEGWRIWNDGDPRTSNVYYGEYGNTGEGAQGPRADFATAMDSPVAIGDILGDYGSAAWFDESYYAGSGADVGDS